MSEFIIDLGVRLDWNEINKLLKKRDIEIDASLDLDVKDADKQLKGLKSKIAGLTASSNGFGDSFYRILPEIAQMFKHFEGQLKGIDAAGNNIDFSVPINGMRELGELTADLISKAEKAAKLTSAIGVSVNTSGQSAASLQDKREQFTDIVLSHYGTEDEADALKKLLGSKAAATNAMGLISGKKSSGKNAEAHNIGAEAEYIKRLLTAIENADGDLGGLKAKVGELTSGWGDMIVSAKNFESALEGIDISDLLALAGLFKELPDGISAAIPKIQELIAAAKEAKKATGEVGQGASGVGASGNDPKKTAAPKKRNKSGKSTDGSVSGTTGTLSDQGVTIDASTFDSAVTALKGSAGELDGAAGALKGAAGELKGAATVLTGIDVENLAEIRSQLGSTSGGNIPTSPSPTLPVGNTNVDPEANRKYASSRSDFSNWGEHQRRGYEAYKAAADSALEMSQSAIAQGAALDIDGVEIPYAEVKLDKTDFSSLVLNNDAQEYIQRLGKGDTSSRAPIEGNFIFDFASSDIRDVYRNGNSDARNLSLGRAADPHQAYREFEERHNGITIEGLQSLARKNPEVFQQHVERIVANGGFMSLRPDMMQRVNERDGKLRWVTNDAIDVAETSILTDLLGQVRESTSFRSIDTRVQKSEGKRTSIPKYERTIKNLTGMSGEEWSLLSEEEQSSKRQSLDRGQKSSLTRAVNERNAALEEQNRIIGEITGVDAESWLGLSASERNSRLASIKTEGALFEALDKWKSIKDPYGEWMSSERTLSGAKSGLQSQLIEDLNDNGLVQHRVNSNYTGATARQLANYNSKIKGDSRRTEGLLGGELFFPAEDWQPLWAKQWVTDKTEDYYKREAHDLNAQVKKSEAKIKALEGLKAKGIKGIGADGMYVDVADVAKDLEGTGISEADIAQAMAKTYDKKVSIHDPDAWFSSTIDSLIEEESKKLYGTPLSDAEQVDLTRAKKAVGELSEALSLKNIGGLTPQEIDEKTTALQRAQDTVTRLESKGRNKGLIALRDKAEADAADRISRYRAGETFEFEQPMQIPSRVLEPIISSPIPDTEEIKMERAKNAVKGIEYTLDYLERDLPASVDGSEAAMEKQRRAKKKTKQAEDNLAKAEDNLAKEQGRLAAFNAQHLEEFGGLDLDGIKQILGVDAYSQVMEKANLDELQQENRVLRAMREESVDSSSRALAENSKKLKMIEDAKSSLKAQAEQTTGEFNPDNYPQYKQLMEAERVLLSQRDQINSQRERALGALDEAIAVNEAQQAGTVRIAAHELGLSDDDNAVKIAKEFVDLVGSVNRASDSVMEAQEKVKVAKAEESKIEGRTPLSEANMQKISDNLRYRTEQAITSAFDQGLISEDQANEFRDRLSKITDYGTIPDVSKEASATTSSAMQHASSEGQSAEDRIKNYLKAKGFSDDDAENFIKNASPKLQEILQKSVAEIDVDASQAQAKLEATGQIAEQTDESIRSIGDEPVDVDASPAQQGLKDYAIASGLSDAEAKSFVDDWAAFDKWDAEYKIDPNAAKENMRKYLAGIGMSDDEIENVIVELELDASQAKAELREVDQIGEQVDHTLDSAFHIPVEAGRGWSEPMPWEVSRNDASGNPMMPQFKEATEIYDYFVQHGLLGEMPLRGTPQLAATEENLMGLFGRAVDLQKKSAGWSKESDPAKIAEAERQLFERMNEFRPLYAEYETETEKKKSLIRKRIKEIKNELKDPDLKPEQKQRLEDELGKKGQEYKNINIGQKQLETFLQRTVLAARDEIAFKDADFKDRFNTERAKQEVKSLKEAYKDVTDLKIKLVGLDESSTEARELTDQLMVAEDRLKSLQSTAKGDWTQDQVDDFDKFTSRQDARLRLKNAKFTDKQTVADIKEIDNAVDELIKAEKDASKLRLKIDGLDENSAEAKQLKAELADIENFIREIKSSIRMDSGASSFLNDEQAKKYADAMKKIANETERAAAKSKDLSAEESAKRTKRGQNLTDDYDRSKAGKGWADHIELGRKYKSLDTPDDKTRQLMTDYAFDYHALTEAIEKYNAALTESGADSERTIQAYNEMIAAQERLEKSYKNAQRAISVDKGRSKQLQDNEKLLQQQQSLLLKMEAWKKKSTKVFDSQSADAKELVEEYKRLEQAIKDCTDVSELKDLNVGFGDLKNKVKAAGLEGESVIDSMKNKFTEYARYAVASFGVMEVVQGLKMMAQEVLEVDTAMTGLLRVTEMTNSETEVMFDKMVNSAKEYGRTLTDTINATADWVRAGFDENTALGLAEVTAMYQNVSDLDYNEASENLLTSYRGFEKQLMSDYEGDTVAAVEHITDVLNELDNQYSVTSAGLGEGLARSASALQIAGNTFEESAA